MARSAKQKAALRKAQLVSARKRKGRGKGKVRRGLSSAGAHFKRNSHVYAGVAIAATYVGAGVAAKNYNKKLSRESALKKAAHRKTLSDIRSKKVAQKAFLNKTSARVAGRAKGPSKLSANRVFVGSQYGKPSVRRRAA